MTPYERLDTWIDTARVTAQPMNYLTVPARVLEWMRADMTVLTPLVGEEITYLGYPVLVGPGYGVGFR